MCVSVYLPQLYILGLKVCSSLLHPELNSAPTLLSSYETMEIINLGLFPNDSYLVLETAGLLDPAENIWWWL